MTTRIYGEIPGFPPGSTFTSRGELRAAGVHPPLQGGISGARDGADSIVVSGGYADDIDQGSELFYTGQGGRDRKTGKQVEDQVLTRGNLGLARSALEHHPVRVTRGSKGAPVYSPSGGYRYDGLYEVVDYWREPGQDGFAVWRFHLIKLADDLPMTGKETAPGISRAEVTIARQMRSSLLAQEIKDLYDHTCQFCGIRLKAPAGPLAQAAHIRPLGKPHNGPDEQKNMLCLCPNDHALFDNGGVYLRDLNTVQYASGQTSQFTKHPAHDVDEQHLSYHRGLFGYS